MRQCDAELLQKVCLVLVTACQSRPTGDLPGSVVRADSLVLERSRCFGACPAYRLSLHTERDTDEWLAHSAVEPAPQGLYAIDVDGDAVGTIALEPGPDIERACWEIGYWLGKPYWGRGIVSEAVIAVSDAGFRETDVMRLYAPVFSGNRRSMRVLEKAG